MLFASRVSGQEHQEPTNQLTNGPIIYSDGELVINGLKNELYCLPQLQVYKLQYSSCDPAHLDHFLEMCHLEIKVIGTCSQRRKYLLRRVDNLCQKCPLKKMEISTTPLIKNCLLYKKFEVVVNNWPLIRPLTIQATIHFFPYSALHF